MPKCPKDNRPLSPHLQVYAWNISSLTSIMHRFTGVVLYLAIVAISWYVILYTYQTAPQTAMPEEICDCPSKKYLTYLLYLVGSGIIFSFYYHFCNGIRHLFWDIGKGYELKIARLTGYLTVFFSILLTVLTIVLIAYFKFM